MKLCNLPLFLSFALAVVLNFFLVLFHEFGVGLMTLVVLLPRSHFTFLFLSLASGNRCFGGASWASWTAWCGFVIGFFFLLTSAKKRKIVKSCNNYCLASAKKTCMSYILLAKSIKFVKITVWPLYELQATYPRARKFRNFFISSFDNLNSIPCPVTVTSNPWL